MRGGLEAALRSYLGRETSTGRLAVDVSADGRRFDPRAEAAAYFCVAGATRDLGPPVQVAIEAPGEDLVLRLSGRPGGPMAISQMRDRVEAAGGSMLARRSGDRTLLDVWLPVGGPPAQPLASRQAADSRSGPKADLVT